MRVAIIMGSTSDLPKVEPAIEILKKYADIQGNKISTYYVDLDISYYAYEERK